MSALLHIHQQIPGTLANFQAPQSRYITLQGTPELSHSLSVQIGSSLASCEGSYASAYQSYFKNTSPSVSNLLMVMSH